MKRKALQMALALGIGLTASASHAALLTGSDFGFGVFDASRGTRTFAIGPGGTITDVNVKIDFAKCDGPAMQFSTNLQQPCPSPTGEEFSSESFFYLISPTGTRVDLIYTRSSTPEGIEQGSTKVDGTYPNNVNVGGRIQVFFDDQAASAVGPVMTTLPGLGLRPEELLSAFNGENAVGNWILGMGDSVGADPLSYFSSFLEITTTDAPEPAPLALLSLGLFGLGALRRRKNVA